MSIGRRALKLLDAIQQRVRLLPGRDQSGQRPRARQGPGPGLAREHRGRGARAHRLSDRRGAGAPRATTASYFADSVPLAGPANYLRFRLSPDAAVALAARVTRPGKEFVGDQRELYMVEELVGARRPYERLLSDAMSGDGALFTRWDAIEAAWAAVDPVLQPDGTTA